MLTCQYDSSFPCLKKDIKTASLTPDQWNSSQNFWECFQVIILSLAQIKFSISYINWLIFFFKYVWCSQQEIRDNPLGVYPELVLGMKHRPIEPHWFLRSSGEFPWHPDLIVKPSRALCAPGHTRLSFCGPHFLLLGNKLQPPWPSLSSKGQAQTVAHQGREWIQRPQGGAVKKQ